MSNGDMRKQGTPVDPRDNTWGQETGSLTISG